MATLPAIRRVVRANSLLFVHGTRRVQTGGIKQKEYEHCIFTFLLWAI